MSNIFTLLEADHREVEQVLARLTAGGGSAETDKELAEKLVMEESRHEAAPAAPGPARRPG